MDWRCCSPGRSLALGAAPCFASSLLVFSSSSFPLSRFWLKASEEDFGDTNAWLSLEFLGNCWCQTLLWELFASEASPPFLHTPGFSCSLESRLDLAAFSHSVQELRMCCAHPPWLWCFQVRLFPELSTDRSCSGSFFFLWGDFAPWVSQERAEARGSRCSFGKEQTQDDPTGSGSLFCSLHKKQFHFLKNWCGHSGSCSRA